MDRLSMLSEDGRDEAQGASAARAAAGLDLPPPVPAEAGCPMPTQALSPYDPAGGLRRLLLALRAVRRGVAR